MANMTKKHFEAIASDIRRVYETVAKTESEKRAVRLVALALCSTFILQNAHFNRDKFLHACGVPHMNEPR